MRAWDTTDHIPQILSGMLQQAAERLVASKSLDAFLEQEDRGRFRREFVTTPDVEVAIKHLSDSCDRRSTWLDPDPNEVTAVADLSGYEQLYVGDVKISDEHFAEDPKVTQREILLAIHSRLLHMLHRKFRTVSAGEVSPAGKSLLLTCDFSVFTFPGVTLEGRLWRHLGPLSWLTLRGRISGVMTLKDRETGTIIAELPIRKQSAFAPTVDMIESVARLIAAFLVRGTHDDTDPYLEVSWAMGPQCLPLRP